MPFSNGAHFAGFRIVRMLGSGAMGEVYLAEHPRLPRFEALKILSPEVSSDAEYQQRFNREADLAAALYHPHIVGVHDRGEDDGQLWIAMDFVKGSDTNQLLKRRYPVAMPRAEVVEIITAVAKALDYAHQKGLLHRDVKPANILIGDKDSGSQRILLADFGIARHTDDISGLTATNMTVGTVSYCAPEQLMGSPIDGRADQYALATTAYHLLTGVVPFRHANPAVVISHHLNAEPPSPSRARPQLADLDLAIGRAMSKDPADRFERCEDFAEALTKRPPATGRTPATSTVTRQPPRKPIPPPAPRQALRRNATPAKIAGVLLALMLIGALIFAGARLSRDGRNSASTVQPQPTTVLAPRTTLTTSSSLATTTITATTSTRTRAAPALPAAVVGSPCLPGSTPTVDFDSATVTCARIESSDSYIWSRTPGVIPYPTYGGKPVDSPWAWLCMDQTGRTMDYCSTALRQATYRGDGRIPMG